ncbi:MAG: GNAT family N-acetyltransferase [Woeseiaceae bacterium]|nr:GNAT family N-acetyltransferase [Woeseiaceae bacterium]
MSAEHREDNPRGWQLTRADDGDMDTLMTWFSSAEEVDVWGGPKFRYPFTVDTFRTDCHWPGMASYCLRDASGSMCAFGQYYDRNGYMNLARLVVVPEQRGRRLGSELVSRLMQAAAEELTLDEFSLFVYRDNAPALKLYQSLGFEIQEYPPDQILADKCFFLTRPR